MVDLHVLTVPERSGWLTQCIKSLKDQPCAIHVVENGTGSIAEMRAGAFKLGTNPYVGYVDDDDLVEPGAVSALIAALDENPNAVGAYTDEVLVSANNSVLGPGLFTNYDWSPLRHLGSPLAVHHLWIGRREFVETYLDDVKHLPIAMGWALTALMAKHGPWIHVPVVGYRWRQHTDSRRNNSAWASPEIKQMAKKIAYDWVEAGVITLDEVPKGLRS